MEYYINETECYWENFTLADVPEYIAKENVFTERDPASGLVALHRIARSCKDIRAIQELIDASLIAGVDVNVQDDDGYTPLAYTAMNNDEPDVINAIVNKDANVMLPNNNGYTPLHHATKHNPRPQVIEALLSNHADVNSRANDGSTPLHGAALMNTPEVIDFILEVQGLNPTIRDNEGNTAFDIVGRGRGIEGHPVHERLRIACLDE